MSWAATRLKFLAGQPVRNGLGESGVEGSLDWPRYVRTTDIAGPRSLRTDIRASLPPEKAAKASLKWGDIVMTAAGATIGKSLLYTEPDTACFAGYLTRFRPKPGVDSRFVAYWMESRPYWAQIETGKVVSTIENFSASKYSNLRLDIPTPSVQRAVADYLDAETARVDALIAKKRRMIELLEEKVDSQIFSAVNGTLTSASSSRESTQIPWLEAIPSHYGSPWLGANHSTQLGKMLSASAASGPEQHRYVKNTNVQWDRFDLTDLSTMTFDANDRARCSLEKGDLLVCEGGEVGRAAVWPGTPADVYFQKAIHRVRPIGEAEPRYTMYAFWAAAKMNVFTVEGNQATIVHLTGEKLREHRFPWPPLEEQREIVRQLDTTREKVETTIARLGQQIGLLAERRQALITAAVTGELEIPGVAA